MAAAGGIERALADQAMHAGFGAQIAEGVFAFDLDRGRLDARDFAVGFFKDLGLEALAFGVLEVLAQQHRGPVLRFRAARARLDVQEAVQRIGRIGEHAAEFQLFELFLECVGVFLNGFKRGIVVVGLGQFEQFVGVGQARAKTGERFHHVFQGFLFTAQVLGVLGVVPDRRVFELGVYNVQAFSFGIVVKDTSVEPVRAPRNRRGGLRAGSDVRLP
ncbi:hypothetical protein D3C73_1047380 [compost metagenome]